VNALDEAEAAQNEARKAIQQASGDIGSAKLDLADVSKRIFLNELALIKISSCRLTVKLMKLKNEPMKRQQR
jgi:hypothetical protein